MDPHQFNKVFWEKTCQNFTISEEVHYLENIHRVTVFLLHPGEYTKISPSKHLQINFFQNLRNIVKEKI